MDSKSSLRLATVDFSKTELLPGSPEWDCLKLQVMGALEEYGCFVAVYDKVPAELHKAVHNSLAAELFDLPLAIKSQKTSPKPFRGYVGKIPYLPLYESMGIDDAPILESAQSFTNLMWPQGNDNFCKAIHSYSKQLSELDQVVRKMILESLGVDKYMEEHLDSQNYLLRVMKYNEPESDGSKLGLAPHTDKNNMTILSQNQVKGLQVQTLDGQYWIDVNAPPNTFVVMVADCMAAWTNGKLTSPLHRVVMTGNEARYSTGLFAIPKAGYIIKAPEELVDEEHPLLFKPFDQAGFSNFYNTPEGRRLNAAALKAYCGVQG